MSNVITDKHTLTHTHTHTHWPPHTHSHKHTDPPPPHTHTHSQKTDSPLQHTHTHIQATDQPTVDGDALLGSVPGGPSALQSLWACQVHKVKLGRQRFKLCARGQSGVCVLPIIQCQTLQIFKATVKMWHTYLYNKAQAPCKSAVGWRSHRPLISRYFMLSFLPRLEAQKDKQMLNYLCMIFHAQQHVKLHI